MENLKSSLFIIGNLLVFFSIYSFIPGIVDYFYGDYNDDNYLDLIVRLNRDGSYSAPSQTSTIIITSFKESEFQIILILL